MANPTQFDFPSPAAFLHYFEQSNKLEIPAHKALYIRNYSLIKPPYPVEPSFRIPDVTRAFSFQLSRVITPLGKEIKIYPIETEYTSKHSFGKDLYLEFSSKVTLLAVEKESLILRLSDLFRMMVISDKSSFELPAPRTLTVCGLLPREATYSNDEIWKNTQSIIGARMPPGCKIHYRFDGTIEACDLSIGGSEKQASFSIIPKSRLFFKCEPEYNFSSISRFKDRLLMGKLNIPANQTWTIEDELIGHFYRSYPSELEKTFSRIEYALNQMVLPSGKRVKFVSSADFTLKAIFQLKLFPQEDILCIDNSAAISLELDQGDLYTNLDSLSKVLINQNESALEIAPGQSLYLHGLERKRLDAVLATQEGQLDRLMDLMHEHNAIGFGWYLSLNEQINIQVSACPYKGVENSEKRLLKLYSPYGFSLELKRANGPKLISNLLKVVSKDVIKGLQERDVNALVFIVFRALIYFCCGDFRYYRRDEYPNCFKEETWDKIFSIVDDVEFTKALREKNQSLDLNEQFVAILKSSPDEFDNLDKDKLPSPIKLIVNRVLEMANTELQGSPLLAECLKEVDEELASTQS